MANGTVDGPICPGCKKQTEFKVRMANGPDGSALIVFCHECGHITGVLLADLDVRTQEK